MTAPTEEDFGTRGYKPDQECIHCEKVTVCLLARCHLGSFDGWTCLKCLAKAQKLRDTMKQDRTRPATPA